VRVVQKIIEDVREQWTDPSAPRGASIPTLQLTDENILTLNAQLEQGLGTRTFGFLARGFKLQPQTRDTITWFIAYTTYPPISCVSSSAQLVSLLRSSSSP